MFHNSHVYSVSSGREFRFIIIVYALFEDQSIWCSKEPTIDRVPCGTACKKLKGLQCLNPDTVRLIIHTLYIKILNVLLM